MRGGSGRLGSATLRRSERLGLLLNSASARPMVLFPTSLRLASRYLFIRSSNVDPFWMMMMIDRWRLAVSEGGGGGDKKTSAHLDALPNLLLSALPGRTFFGSSAFVFGVCSRRWSLFDHPGKYAAALSAVCVERAPRTVRLHPHPLPASPCFESSGLPFCSCEFAAREAPQFPSRCP